MHNSSVKINPKKNTAIYLAIAFCFPVLLYIQTLSFGFTDYDDNAIIINNYDFLSNPGNASKAFNTDAFLLKNHSSNASSYIGDIFYRPLQTLSYMTDIWISGGSNTWMFHFSNVMLLGLVGCLLFLFFRKFQVQPRLAILFTLVYCAHPLFVSNVSWIPARGDLLLMVFSLLSFLFFINFLQNSKITFLVTSWLSFTCALFCKETAALLPLVFITYYYSSLSNRHLEKKHLNLFIPAVLLFIISVVTWYWLRSMATGNFSNFHNIGFLPFLKNLRTVPESIAMFFFPVKIAPVPAYSIFNTLMGIVIILIITYINFIKNDCRKEKIFCLLWFLFLLVPTMFYKNEHVDYLNHRFFLPLLGVFLFTFFSIPKKWFEEKEIVSSWMTVAIVVILSTLTFLKTRSFSDPMTFYNSVIAHNQHNALMYNNRGYEFEIRKEINEAISDYSKAIEINSEFALAYYNRGNAYGMIGNLDGAIEDYNKTIALNPDNADAYINRGNVYYGKGNFEMAINDYNKVVMLNPGYVSAYNNRGTAYDDLGDHERAIKDFNKAIELNPFFSLAYYNRGTAYKAKGMLNEAEQDFIMYERLTHR